MNVVVDTSVWSLALRRNTPNDVIAIVNILRDLIADGRVVLLGVIRQEGEYVTFASERTALTLNPSPRGRGTLKPYSPSPRGRRGWGM